jgi:hypothetical protein
MKDEEFKKKLEFILENLYKIDREIEKYFGENISDEKKRVIGENRIQKVPP